MKFTDLPSELRGEVANHLDVKSIVCLKAAAWSADGTGLAGAPLLDNNTLDPLLQKTLGNSTLRQIVRVASDKVDPFVPGALNALRRLRDDQHRNEIRAEIENTPSASHSQRRTKALQLIKECTDIASASRADKTALLGGRESTVILPPIQRLLLATDPETSPAVLKRLAKNLDISIDESIAIAIHRHAQARPHDASAIELDETGAPSPVDILIPRIRLPAEREAFLNNRETPAAIIWALAKSSKKNNTELLKILGHPGCYATTIEIIAKTASRKTASSALRIAVINHHLVTPYALSLLAKSNRNLQDRMAILQATLRKYQYPLSHSFSNYATTQNPLADLAKDAIDARERATLSASCNGDAGVLAQLAATEKDPELRRQFMDNPSCTDLVLAGLAKSATTNQEFAEILRHHATEGKTLEALASKMPNHLLRMEALQHPKMTHSALQHFAVDAVNDDERNEIMQHPKLDRFVIKEIASGVLTKQHRMDLIDHNNMHVFGLTVLAKTATDPAERIELANHPKARDIVRRELARVTSPPLANKIDSAKNILTSQPELLKQARTAIHPVERLALAENTSTPTKGLDVLAKNTKYPAERLAISKNSNTSTSALKALASHLLYDEEITAIATHPHADRTLLESLRSRIRSDFDRAHVDRLISRMP